MAIQKLEKTKHLTRIALTDNDRWPVYKAPRMRKYSAQYWYFGKKRIVMVQESVREKGGKKRFTAAIMHSQYDHISEYMRDFDELTDAWKWARDRALMK